MTDDMILPDSYRILGRRQRSALRDKQASPGFIAIYKRGASSGTHLHITLMRNSVSGNVALFRPHFPMHQV